MRNVICRTFLMLMIACLPCASQQWNGIIASSRAVDWTGTGATIPTRTTICTTLTSSATSAQILSAMSACPSGQVVFLSAGNYTLASGLCAKGISNITLRGAGADHTFITLTNDCSTTGATGFVGMSLASGDQNYKGSIANGPVNVTGTFTKGQTTLTFATVPNLKVGNPFMLDQNDDSVAPCDDGSIVVSASSTSCGSATSPGIVGPYSLEGNGGGAQRSGRNQMRVFTVTGCGGVTAPGASCSGSNVSVSFTPGLDMPNWRSGQSPQAWWATNPAHDIGIENMSIDVSGAGNVPGIAIANCDNCWVTGVRGINSARSHIQIDYSQRITVQSSYFFLTQNSQSQSYGVECYGSSDVLVENNIFQAVTSPWMINGSCSRSVVAANYEINNYYTGSSRYSIAGENDHTAGIDNVLFESNYGNQLYGDVFHGTKHFVTHYRNRMTGPQPTCWISGSTYATSVFGSCNNNLGPYVLLSFSRFYNAIGNVFGTSGVNTTNASIWDTGSGNSNGTVTVPADTNVTSTLMRWGNWDVVNGTQFVNGQVPSGLSGTQAPYANPVPASQTLPASFYLNSRPSYWPSSIPWPAIGPDVTGGNIAGVSGHAYMIPSQDCAINTMGMPADGTGPVLSFNADTCYGNMSPVIPPAPSPVSFTMLNGSVGISGRIGK